jgi:hypothetical protein
MDSVAREQQAAGLWQPDQKRLMSRRMTGGRNNRHAAVTENVVVALKLGNWMLSFKAWTTTPHTKIPHNE